MGLFEYIYASGPARRSEVQDLARRMKNMRRSDSVRQDADERRIDELERDLMRVAMATRTLADLCMAKGVFTAEEFQRQLAEADIADGVADGGLDPKFVMPGQGCAPSGSDGRPDPTRCSDGDHGNDHELPDPVTR